MLSRKSKWNLVGGIGALAFAVLALLQIANPIFRFGAALLFGWIGFNYLRAIKYFEWEARHGMLWPHKPSNPRDMGLLLAQDFEAEGSISNQIRELVRIVVDAGADQERAKLNAFVLFIHATTFPLLKLVDQEISKTISDTFLESVAREQELETPGILDRLSELVVPYTVAFQESTDSRLPAHGVYLEFCRAVGLPTNTPNPALELLSAGSWVNQAIATKKKLEAAGYEFQDSST